MSWETEARNWIAWARKPGFDSYWRFHREELEASTTRSRPTGGRFVTPALSSKSSSEIYDHAHAVWRELPIFLRLDARTPG